MTNPAEGKIPVIACIGGAYEFLVANFAQMLPVMVLLAVASIAVNMALPPSILTFFAFSIVLAPFQAAFLRKAIHQKFEGFFGIQLGRDEFNIMAVNLMLLGLFILLSLIASVVLAFILSIILANAGIQAEDLEDIQATPEMVMQMLAENLSSLDIFMLSLVGFALLFGLAWISARLALAQAATIGSGQIKVLETWEWTKGNALRLILTFLAVIIPFQLANLLLLPIGPGGVVVLMAIISAIGALAQSGLSAILYQGLKPTGE